MAKVGTPVKAGSALRAMPPAWPASRGATPTTPNYDRLVNMAVSRLIDISQDPQHPAHQRLRATLPVLARDGEGERQDRRRLARNECVQNTLRYALELLSRADQRSGFVGRPPGAAGQRWERWHQYRLGTFAFGQYVPGEVGPSRSKRADQRLKEVGFIKRDQVRRKVMRPGGSEWVSDVSIVRVTRLFWAWLGLLGEWTKMLRGGERAEGEARARRFASRRPPTPPQAPPSSPAPATPAEPVKRSDRPPLTAAEQLERFKAARALLDGHDDTGSAD